MSTIGSILDIAKWLGALSPDRTIKISSSGNETVAMAANGIVSRDEFQLDIWGMDANVLADAIGRAKLYEPIAELEGQTIGLDRLSVLSGYSKLNADGQCNLEYEADTPIELHFDNGDGHEAWYRFTSGRYTSGVVKIPPYRDPTCEVTFSPSAKALKLFHSAMIRAEEIGQKYFWPMMSPRGYLFLSFETQAPHNGTVRFEMERNLPYVDIPPISFCARDVWNVLKHAADAKSMTVGIATKGFIKIDVDSGIGLYTFIFFGSDHLVWHWDWAGRFPQVWCVERVIREDKCMHVDWEPPL